MFREDWHDVKQFANMATYWIQQVLLNYWLHREEIGGAWSVVRRTLYTLASSFTPNDNEIFEFLPSYCQQVLSFKKNTESRILLPWFKLLFVLKASKGRVLNLLRPVLCSTYLTFSELLHSRYEYFAGKLYYSLGDAFNLVSWFLWAKIWSKPLIVKTSLYDAVD